MDSNIKPTYNASMCSAMCPMGAERRRQRNCCWECRQCLQYEYVSIDHKCERCSDGFTSNVFRNACVTSPILYTSYSDPIGITGCVLASIGIVLCVIIAAIYVRFRTTPIIKAAGFELSIVLLFGIFLSYCSTFAFLAKPSIVVCSIVRFLLGLCVTICYATITIKTWRICKIFGLRDNPGKLTLSKQKIISAKSSLLIAILLIAIEVVGVGVWTISDFPQTSKLRASGDDLSFVLVCRDSTNNTYVVVLIWPCVLIVSSIYFAIKSRKTPDGFQETKYIMFCSFATLIVGLAFLPPYLAINDSKVKVASLCVAFTANASVILGLLFLKKVYIVLFSPQENTKEVVMSRSSHNMEVTPSNLSNISGLRCRAGKY